LAALKNFQTNNEKAKIMQESYDKRLNILIPGVKEDGDNVREIKEKNNRKIRIFFVRRFAN